MRHSSFRRGGVAAAVGTALALAATACGGDTATSGAGSAGGVLRVVLNSQPATLDPVVGARSDQYVWGTIVEPLIGTGDDLEPAKDGIITDWARENDTTWTFEVRPGVEFSNGEKADAAAVAGSILLNRDGEKAILKSYLGNVESVEARDADTVEVKTGTPQYNIPNLLTNIFLMPPKYYAEQGTAGFTAHPVGTGAFVWKEQQPGRSISVTANDAYWGAKTALPGVTFTWSPDAAQRLALLRSKAADVVFDLPPAQAKEAEDAGLDVQRVKSAMKIVGFLQSDKAPFDDPKVREAAALAVDRDAIVASIFEGQATADAGLLNVKPDEQPTASVKADPERAKSLLNGKVTIPLTYPAKKYTYIDEVAQAVGGQLEEAGFTVEYNPVDYGSLTTEVVTRKISGLYLFAGVPNVAAPDYFAHGFLTSDSITANCASPEFDELAAAALEKADPAAAQPLYDELNTKAVVDEHCYLPLYKQTFSYATSGVTGIEYNALNAVLFDRAEMR
ncbi:peptide/nickel transport system substrate-binding protein [Actinocorallia herbida]|uniref:Peptide/nickel transport system substrate-binding protein n=1 Tax=Actinocorallia herbida TaxID=58109 RepID=A0A3N1CYG4_9ACTN|nr:ABC transporter substrate-binding protein [Actinocorallia herbida]ROO85798.1 peptide/nickel transport system substrate-binding protein [Actinocorallia herbida]